MSVRTRLFNMYWTLRRAIVPTLRYSQYWYEEALKRYVTPSVEWVEIGCGHAIFRVGEQMKNSIDKKL